MAWRHLGGGMSQLWPRDGLGRIMSQLWPGDILVEA